MYKDAPGFLQNEKTPENNLLSGVQEIYNSAWFY